MRMRGSLVIGTLLGALLIAGPSVSPADAAGRELAVEVLGDVRTADRIVVVVPGADVDRAHFDGLRSMAAAVYDEARAGSATRGQRVAVVAWAGYRTPAGLGIDAGQSRLAEAGATALLGYIRSLAADRPADDEVRVGLLCHSYGSVVCAHAAPSLAGTGVEVTDLVAFASPGMDVPTADRLGTDARVWAARSASDWVAWVPNIRVLGLGHGRDPLAPEFGARRLAVPDAKGHDGYLLPGTASLRTLTAAAVGLSPITTPEA